MKKLVFSAMVLFVLKLGLSQNQNYFTGDRKSTPKFTTKHVVNKTDSLLNNTIKINLSQAGANYILLDNEQVSEAIEDIKANMPFEDFIEKYDCKKKEKGLRVTRFKYKNHENKQVTEFTSLEAIETGVHHMNFMGDTLETETPWVVDHREKSDFSNEAIQAFYFTEEFSSLKMPSEYTHMVQQTTSMADSTSEFLRQKLNLLNTQLGEAKQLEASWLLLSHNLVDKAVRRKRREMLMTGLINLLPLLLLTIR